MLSLFSYHILSYHIIFRYPYMVLMLKNVNFILFNYELLTIIKCLAIQDDDVFGLIILILLSEICEYIYISFNLVILFLYRICWLLGDFCMWNLIL